MTTDIRILYITPGCFDKGGISRYCRYQISALRDICGKDNIRVYSLRGKENGDFEQAFETYWNGKIGPFKFFNRLILSILLYVNIFFWRPQIVFMAHVNFTPLIIPISRLLSVRTILNVYGLELWSGLSRHRRKSMQFVDRIIADCYATAQYVQSNCLHRTYPSVIWDCVALDRFMPREKNEGLMERYNLPNPQKHKIVMSLGRLSKAARHKGFDRLITEFSLIRQDFDDLRLVIAGDGDDRERLKQIADSLGIGDRVFFTGAINENDLPYVYCYASVFSLVSDVGFGRGEGLPLTPLEAMACGVPIIVGNEDGSKEAIDNNRNGRIVSPRIPGQLAQALSDLLQANSTLLSRESRQVAVERFGYESFKEKTRSLLHSLLEN